MEKTTLLFNPRDASTTERGSTLTTFTSTSSTPATGAGVIDSWKGQDANAFSAEDVLRGSGLE